MSSSVSLKTMIRRECVNWRDTLCEGVGFGPKSPTAVRGGEPCPVPSGACCHFFERCVAPLGLKRPDEYRAAVYQYQKNVLNLKRLPAHPIKSTPAGLAGNGGGGGRLPIHLPEGVRASEGL